MTKRSAFKRAISRQFMKLALAAYRRSGGRIGGTMKAAPVLLLSSTGRRSGNLWTNPVIYQRDGERIIVIASAGGGDRQPSWWLNLQSTPEAVVELGREQDRSPRARSRRGRATPTLGADGRRVPGLQRVLHPGPAARCRSLC